MVTTSPGLLALPAGMFSAVVIMPMMLILGFSSVKAVIAPKTEAAPHMSNFISSMPAPGLRLIPPVSKVMPLPRIMCGASLASAAPWYFMMMNLPGSLEPFDTETKAPAPMASSSASSMMIVSMSPVSSASASACSAK